MRPKRTLNEVDEEQPYILIATLQCSSNTQKQQRTIRSVSFAPLSSPNIRYMIAVASFDGSVSIWEDFSTEPDSTVQSHYSNGWECTAQLEGHENEVKDVVWNSTGTLLATCGRDKSVWIWECFLPGSIGGDGTGQRGYSARNSGGGGGEGEYECIAVLQGHSGDVKCIRFAPSQGQWGDGAE
jgi:WD40 repeat protein